MLGVGRSNKNWAIISNTGFNAAATATAGETGEISPQKSTKPVRTLAKHGRASVVIEAGSPCERLEERWEGQMFSSSGVEPDESAERAVNKDCSLFYNILRTRKVQPFMPNFRGTIKMVGIITD